MKHIQDKIKAFAEDPDNAKEALFLLKVGHEQRDRPEVIMQRVIAYVLHKYEGIPVQRKGSTSSS